MIANPRFRRFPAAAMSLALALGGCGGQVIPPAPHEPRPAPPPPRPRPPPADWRDAPATPGIWSWGIEDGRSVARFGAGLIVMRCNRVEGTVTLLVAADVAGPVPVTVTTTTLSRTVSAARMAGPSPAIAATLPARDPLLDAMAFSRGRFAIAAPGIAALYVPNWPEVSRVVEDCR